MRTRARWIHNPGADLALALAWVPFAIVAHAAQGDRRSIGLVLSATFLLSFAHQPLTLPFVYGDPEERSARRRLYAWCPPLFLAAAVVGQSVSVSTVAVIAGLWNAEHTLMQRFGITRIYGRKAGEAAPSDGRLERAMLFSWLVLAATWAAAEPGTVDRVRRLRLGTVNAEGLRILTSLHTVAQWLLPVVAVTVAVVTVRWLAVERRRWAAGAGNPAKWIYVGATAGLVVTMLVDPIAGFVAYIGAHALEYFVIVHRSLGSRWAEPGSGGAVGRIVRVPGGRRRFLAIYVVAIVAFAGALRWHGDHRIYVTAVLTLGGLHVLYDGFIWKLRKPSVAAGLVSAPA